MDKRNQHIYTDCKILEQLKIKHINVNYKKKVFQSMLNILISFKYLKNKVN